MEKNTTTPCIDGQRLLARLQAMGEIGALPGGGVCRLAFSQEDRLARDRLCAWMRELDLEIQVDAIGNIIGTRPGLEDGPPVMTGSHIDTVATGGLYDGTLGVLAGLEVVAVLNDRGIRTRKPLAVAAFSNEEGARFAPDMMGSLVYQGGMSLDQALAVQGIDGVSVGEALAAIGYRGEAACGNPKVAAYVELHIEQGPVLEREAFAIGVVEGVQGIHWREYSVQGVSNHAGTTPMALRHDAGYVAMAVATELRRLTREIPGQLATVGRLQLTPDLINVIPQSARFTVDLRNTDKARLQETVERLSRFVETTATAEGVTVTSRTLADFDPVAFDPALVQRVEDTARELGHSLRRLPSGAGHDAQMLARVCPSAMIFVPSVGGISHNIREYTHKEDLEAGANVLLRVLLSLCS